MSLVKVRKWVLRMRNGGGSGDKLKEAGVEDGEEVGV